VIKRNRSVTAKPSGIKARRRERKREEILKAGLKVFAEKGYKGATMDDIALELEATKGLLYHHFKTKDEILNTILTQNDLIAGIEAAMVAPEGVSPVDAVRAAVRGGLALLESNRQLVRFLHVQALLSTREAELVYTKVLNRLYEAAARWLESFKQSGQVRADVDTRALGRFMVDAISHHFLVREVFGPETTPGYLDGMLDILRQGIQAHPSEEPAAAQPIEKPAAPQT
jgi:AcrR family transcriptional regulator